MAMSMLSLAHAKSYPFKACLFSRKESKRRVKKDMRTINDIDSGILSLVLNLEWKQGNFPYFLNFHIF